MADTAMNQLKTKSKLNKLVKGRKNQLPAIVLK